MAEEQPTDATAAAAKPKRGGSKPILKLSGIGRVDNSQKATLFQPAIPINQKNYYTEYLKKDDQILFYRELAEEQKRQKELKKLQEEKKQDVKEKKEDDDEDEEDEPEAVGSKVIVLHPGSRNLRVGLATQAYPKSIPNVIAHRVHAPTTTAEDESGEPMDTDQVDENFDSAHKQVQEDLITRMKYYKRRVLPNSHQTVVNFNSRMEYEEIPDHNDPYRIEWTSTEENPKKEYYTGEKAIRIPPDSKPQYKLLWPIKNGLFNEEDYTTPQQLLGDISLIIIDALEENLKITFKEYPDHDVVLMIPDLYDKTYVEGMVKLLLDMGFKRVSILQESMGATFGAGISTACIIDVGAQKTSISCVEEGMVIADSRVHLKFGGDDITSALIKMLVKSAFPYRDIDIKRPYDWELANELKTKFGTANDADIAVQLYSFYQRSPHSSTRKYQFKTFDEVMCSTLGLFYPELFDLEGKLKSRYKLFAQPIDIYEESNKTSDPISDAQINIALGHLASEGKSYTALEEYTTPATSNGTTGDADKKEEKKDEPKEKLSEAAIQSAAFADVDQRAVPYIGLDHAIIESVSNAALKSQGAKASAFYENLMVVGGAAKFSGFSNLLTDRIGMFAQQSSAYTGDIAVMPVPREMDPELITWKGGGVFSKLKIANELWITSREWDLFGARCLQYKVLFLY